MPNIEQQHQTKSKYNTIISNIEQQEQTKTNYNTKFQHQGQAKTNYDTKNLTGRANKNQL